MIFWGETAGGEKKYLGEPEEILLVHDIDAPADMLTLIYPSGKPEELEYIYAYENGDIAFAGVVDEQIGEFTANGARTKIIARSLAALLLDNEAMPQTLWNPSLRTIAEKYLKPLGFNCVIGADGGKPLRGAFVIPKGSSVWSVLENYCRTFLGSTPYITPDGVIYSYTPEDGEIELSSIAALEIRRRPYARIAKVYVQSESGAYDALFSNAAMKSGKVRYCAQNGGRHAADIIREGEEQSEIIKVKTPGFQNIPAHSRVNFTSPAGERFENLIIESIRYSLNKSGELQLLTLKRASQKEGICG